MTDMLKNCQLCPRACGADRTKSRGACGAGIEIEAARASLHMWEEPPISGTNGSGTVFFSHCSLGCVFCQNRKISRREAEGQNITADALAKTFLSLEKKGAHNINLVTGAHYVPQIIEALQIARKQGLSLPVVYNSSGYEQVETLQLLDGHIDIYLPDYKYYSSYYAGLYSHAEDYREFAVPAIDEMVRQTGAPQFDKNGLLILPLDGATACLSALCGSTRRLICRIIPSLTAPSPQRSTQMPVRCSVSLDSAVFFSRTNPSARVLFPPLTAQDWRKLNMKTVLSIAGTDRRRRYSDRPENL